MRAALSAALAVALLPSFACGHGAASPPMPTQTEWDIARAWLDRVRATVPSRPFGALVKVSLREPRTRQSFAARGALAVDPGHALRMILVGPGGATALDVWATRDRWRFEVPAANVLRRGGSEDDPLLPIGFFRWWFLGPVDGRLLSSAAADAGQRFILRDGASTVDVTLALREASVADGAATVSGLTAARLSGGATDRIELHATSLAMAKGDHAIYDEDSSGVHVEVTVEDAAGAPDPDAFANPDALVAPEKTKG